MVRLHQGAIPVQPMESATTNTDDIFGIGQIPLDYYNGTENLTDKNLKKLLHHIIRNHKVFNTTKHGML